MSLTDYARSCVRGLRTDRSASIVVVVILAFALAGVASLSALVEALLFRTPAGLHEPESLVALFATPKEDPQPRGLFPWADYQDLRQTVLVGDGPLSGVIARARFDAALTTDAVTERVQGAAISDDWFTVLGVTPARGRHFGTSESESGSDLNERVAVLEYGTWQRVFGGDEGLIGDSISLNGANLTVIGIAPPGFRGPSRIERTGVWVPIALYGEVATGVAANFGGERDRQQRWLSLHGRLEPSAGLKELRSALDVIDARIDAENEPNGEYRLA